MQLYNNWSILTLLPFLAIFINHVHAGRFSQFIDILKINEEAKLSAKLQDDRDCTTSTSSEPSNSPLQKQSILLGNSGRVGGGAMVVEDEGDYDYDLSTSTESDDEEPVIEVASAGTLHVIREGSTRGILVPDFDDHDEERVGENVMLSDAERIQAAVGNNLLTSTDDQKRTPQDRTGAPDRSEVQPMKTISYNNGEEVTVSAYMSSGLWVAIDRCASLGLCEKSELLRLSRHLYSVRKAASRASGLSGLLSGKGKDGNSEVDLNAQEHSTPTELDEQELESVRKRIEAIETARAAAARADLVQQEKNRRRGAWRRIIRRRRPPNANNIQKGKRKLSNDESAGFTVEEESSSEDEIESAEDAEAARIKAESAILKAAEEHKRKERVCEIDRQMAEYSEKLLQLACEKDGLQRRPNPLFNYTSITSDDGESDISTTRAFNFPPPDVVHEYINEVVSSGRLVFLNHTSLWSSAADEEESDEIIGDDLFVPSTKSLDVRAKPGAQGNVGGGSWLLRQTLLGGGMSLGEKLGESVETSAYKAVCQSVMSVLARSISGIHGLNVLRHSDIRLHLNSAPDLPPVGQFPGDHDSYAAEAIRKAIKRGAAKRKIRDPLPYDMEDFSDEAFVQRAALVETLISHCQISAPLLKLFPLAWQRALLGNIITLITAIISDFCAGIRVQILGHYLSLSFKPITEADMMQNLNFNLSRRKASKWEEFEDAVAATAKDIAQSLTFLDKWHERLLGGDILKIQIGTLIARIVLTLVEEVLGGFRIDLWSSQAGGPVVNAELEFRGPQEILL